MEHTLHSSSQKTKKLYFELMRIIAILFVVFNHTGTDGFFLYQYYPWGSLKFWLFLFISIFCKFAVPLFFAISGALMLGREDEPLKTLWFKRILRMAIVLLAFSILYLVCYRIFSDRTYTIKEAIATIYSSEMSFELWYLYAYIAYLIGLPFLRNMVRNLDTKYFYYMFGIVILFNIIPIFEYLGWQQSFTMNANIKPSWLLTNIVLYPCMGYFLEHRIDINKFNTKRITMLGGVNVIGIFLSVLATYYRGCVMGEISEGVSQVFYNNFALINCMFIFLLVKKIVLKINIRPQIERIILSLGECTFGIYLLHIMVMKSPPFKAIHNILFGCGIHPMIACWIDILGIVLGCYIVTYILKKIPIIKKLL